MYVGVHAIFFAIMRVNDWIVRYVQTARSLLGLIGKNSDVKGTFRSRSVEMVHFLGIVLEQNIQDDDSWFLVSCRIFSGGINGCIIFCFHSNIESVQDVFRSDVPWKR